MKQIYLVVAIIILAVSLVSVGFTNQQVKQERESLAVDLQYRTSVLAGSLTKVIESNLRYRSSDYPQSVINMFSSSDKFAGLAIYDKELQLVGISEELKNNLETPPQIVSESINEAKVSVTFQKGGENNLFFMAVPYYSDENIAGVLLIAQKADYIEERILERWKSSLLRLLIQDLILLVVLLLLGRWFVYEPLKKLENSIRLSKINESAISNSKINAPTLFRPLQKEISLTIKKL